MVVYNLAIIYKRLWGQWEGGSYSWHETLGQATWFNIVFHPWVIMMVRWAYLSIYIYGNSLVFNMFFMFLHME